VRSSLELSFGTFVSSKDQAVTVSNSSTTTKVGDSYTTPVDVTRGQREGAWSGAPGGRPGGRSGRFRHREVARFERFGRRFRHREVAGFERFGRRFRHREVAGFERLGGR
jgi:hypothetical protein